MERELTLTFTHIDHIVRRQLNINVLEYCLVDMVFRLSTNPNSTNKGWCYMSRETTAREIGLSKRGLIKIIDRLVEQGLLKKQSGTGHLKTTPLWNDTYFASKTIGEQSAPRLKKSVNKVHRVGEQSALDNGEQSAPNTNTIDTNKISVSNTHNFNEFWEAYPCKQGKKKALAAYLVAASKAEPSRICAAAKSYYNANKDKGNVYWMHASNWLAEERYEDESAPEKKTIATKQITKPNYSRM